VPERLRQYDPSCGRKFIDIEREIDEYFEKDACERVESVPEDGLLLDKSREADKQTLLWELCLTGETGRKAGTIRRDSPVWTLFGIDPDELMTLSPQDAATIVLFSLLKLTGIGAKAPDEASLQKLWTWFTETHLPSEEPKETTDHALKCAADVGLVHPMETIFDEESGEPVGETEVEGRGSTRFVRHVEAKDDLNRIVARVKLSRSGQLVLMGMREGFIGEELENWVEGQGQGVERSSVPVLATRVRTKLRAAARQ
jgi:hypothetical protein